ncbi:hypothetical protein ACCO45_010006 [Purpureocillium lilacinum]|uniref:Uncharacterized protein n=1 Tax=Purpureocillium lilacinum TaxID=33203 RepID=A0ACC4DGL3_PURLI
MASHSIANVLHCAINPTFNDGTINNPQIILESLLSTIKAVENGNGRDPPARREETYSSIGDLLGGRHLDSITIVFAAITDGRVSKCVFRANGCCTLLPDVATCHSSPGHYMGTPGPLWFGEQDGVLVSRAFDAWSDTQLITAPVERAWLRIDPYVLGLCHEDVIEVRDNRGVACIATLSHPGVAGFSPTRAAGTWVSYSSETVKIWKLQGNLPQAGCGFGHRTRLRQDSSGFSLFASWVTFWYSSAGGSVKSMKTDRTGNLIRLRFSTSTGAMQTTVWVLLEKSYSLTSTGGPCLKLAEAGGVPFRTVHTSLGWTAALLYSIRLAQSEEAST